MSPLLQYKHNSTTTTLQVHASPLSKLDLPPASKSIPMTVPVEDEQTKILAKILDWCPDVPNGVDDLIHVLIERQALQRPEAQAICSWDGDITYRVLDDISSRLATHLMSRGVKAETIVPLCFEKSLWAIVGVLGVLKAGGVFVLLDPSQPISRMETIVQQTGAKIGLSSQSSLETCKELVDKVLVVDASTTFDEDASKAKRTITSSNAAYIIFTSGSTGTPKGVVIEHSQLCTTATYVGERLGYNTTSRVFQFASYAFDACITDIFATLAHGGTICIPSDWDRNNGTVDAMRRMQVTTAKFTPSLVQNLVIEDVPTLDTIILGGESPPTTLVEELSSKWTLILVYGPTECCVICFISNASLGKPAPGEIGRPVGSRGWIVKQGNGKELVRIGEVGELVIEGAQVGRGYLNDEIKTAKQFLPHAPWMRSRLSRKKKHRLYRTGDLAKYLDDGRVCYVGRVDNQVKIRGQRLELEEVEKKLHDCLTETLQVDVEHIIVDAVIFPGLPSKNLVAFMCLDAIESYGHLDWSAADGVRIRTSTSEQEAFAGIVSKVETALKLALPAYAIPAIWIPLHTIPFTVSRKKDRKRLRSCIEKLSVKQISTFITPIVSNGVHHAHTEMTSKERLFQELWSAAFRVKPETIDVEDNFFSLGGDSVIAIKLIAAARAKGLDLSLDIVFRAPTLRDMASATHMLKGGAEEIVPLPPFSLLNAAWNANTVIRDASTRCRVSIGAIEDIYPSSPMSEGLLALSMKDPGTYVLQFVYQVPESIDISRLRRAWEGITRRTHLLRTRFIDYESELLQVVINEPLEWNTIEGDLVNYLAAEKQRNVDLGLPMSRIAVIRPNSKQTFLVWIIHHALVDGWSESDVTSLVEQEYFAQGSNATPIPQFNTFIKYIREQDLKSGQDFWRNQLAMSPMPTFPPLPDPSYKPKVQRSNRIDHHLASHEDAELQHKISLLQKGSATPATMLQAAWFILVGLYSNSHDVITGVTLNGRTARLAGIDSIPGPTVTTVPFRAQFSPDQSISSFLQAIQTQYLDILPYAQFGLQNIRRLGDGAVNACKFRSLLVVQSANKPQSERKVLLGRSYSFPVMDFAIVMECELLDGSIDFRATFDHAVLSEEQVRFMFKQMEGILEKISRSGPESEVSDLMALSDEGSKRIAELRSTMVADIPRSNGVAVYEPPSTDMENVMYRLWTGLLETDKFGIHDNFFELGGGSVLAMRLVSLARREGCIITVAGVFQAPTLKDMALIMKVSTESSDLRPFILLSNEELNSNRQEAASQCQVKVDQIQDIYPCTAMQLHYVTGYPEAQKDTCGPWNWQSQAVYALPLSIDTERFVAAWNTIISRHQALRTRLIQTSNEIFQCVLLDSPEGYWKTSQDVDSYLIKDRIDSMRFGTPLLRLAIINSQKNSAITFVMTAHHTIYDAFSRTMLFSELTSLYNNPNTPLPSPSTRMNEYIAYITQTPKSAAMDFWSSYLANTSTRPLVTLPIPHPSLNITEKEITIPQPSFHNTECTLPTLIEITISLVLAHHLSTPSSGPPQDILLNSDRSGRNLPLPSGSLPDLIGPTTLFLPVRIPIRPHQTISSLLREAQNSQREMIQHEHLGWLELREMQGFEELKKAVNCNINPMGMGKLGGELGMKYLGDWAGCDDPVGVNVDLDVLTSDASDGVGGDSEGKGEQIGEEKDVGGGRIAGVGKRKEKMMSWTIYLDERFLELKRVERMLVDLEKMFGFLIGVAMEKKAGMLVGDALSILDD